MTKQQKLTKLIEQAVENGWDFFEYDNDIVKWENWRVGQIRVWFTNSVDGISSSDFVLQEILFDHDFAKAIWKRKKRKYVVTSSYSRGGVLEKSEELRIWQHHLQQAVISNDPLEYYWENK